MLGRSSQPRKIDVHLALTRPLLLMGCEREPLLISATIAVALVFMLGNVALAVLGLVFWASAIGVLQRMTAADDRMSAVYLRHIKYRSFYPAQSSPHAVSPAIKKHQ